MTDARIDPHVTGVRVDGEILPVKRGTFKTFADPDDFYCTFVDNRNGSVRVSMPLERIQYVTASEEELKRRLNN